MLDRGDACRRREHYDRLLGLDHAGWAWESAQRNPEGRRLLRSYQRGRLLRKSPPVRVLASEKGDEPAAWGWLIRAIR